jgi:hypothetical protein
MQFIEKNSFNVRSAIYHLKKDDNAPEFLLFPMIHVGTKEFYEEISRRLNACDLILVEGVESKRVNLLTSSYRIVRKIKRMDLITQQEGMNLTSLRGKLCNTDMTGRSFEQRWSSLPLALRAQLFLIIPIYAVYLFLFGTRELIAENIALEDLASPEEILNRDDDLETLLLDERDRKLIDHINKLQATGKQGNQLIGIVYGAGHMRNVTDYLFSQQKYQVAKAEWITVFDL